MFVSASRYASIEDAEYIMPDDRVVIYKKRRILPRGEEMPVLATVTVEKKDRLDLLTARTIGQSDQFWRIADANNAMHPLWLMTTGRHLRVPVPLP
jgi:hypothetical protein